MNTRDLASGKLLKKDEQVLALQYRLKLYFSTFYNGSLNNSGKVLENCCHYNRLTQNQKLKLGFKDE